MAIAESYDAETGLAGFIQRNKFKAGDAVKIISPGRLSRELIAEELYDDRESRFRQYRTRMKFKVRVPFEIKPEILCAVRSRSHSRICTDKIKDRAGRYRRAVLS